LLGSRDWNCGNQCDCGRAWPPPDLRTRFWWIDDNIDPQWHPPFWKAPTGTPQYWDDEWKTMLPGMFHLPRLPGGPMTYRQVGQFQGMAGILAYYEAVQTLGERQAYPTKYMIDKPEDRTYRRYQEVIDSYGIPNAPNYWRSTGPQSQTISLDRLRALMDLAHWEPDTKATLCKIMGYPLNEWPAPRSVDRNQWCLQCYSWHQASFWGRQVPESPPIPPE
jgi:hypothetical protein